MFANALGRSSTRWRLQQKWLDRYEPLVVARKSALLGQASICHRCYAQNALAKPKKSRDGNKAIRKVRRSGPSTAAPFPHKQERKQRFENPQIVELRKVCASTDTRFSDIVSAYAAVEDKRNLTRSSFYGVTQTVHYRLKQWHMSAAPKDRNQEHGDAIVAFAEQLVKDLRMGFLQPSFGAHVHLLSIFKEKQGDAMQSGIRLWDWLRQQDESFVDSATYGAAIEMLAVNGSPLEELEVLYQEALRRFPGNFDTYHLSPHAMVADRTSAVNLKGLPIGLLQGITIARLLRGDSRNAYLALDTMLRLLPTQVPARMFGIFMDERPLLEAYTVFAIACRSGVALLPQPSLGFLLRRLRQTGDAGSARAKFFCLRAMLSTIYLHIGAGGRATRNNLNELIISLAQILRSEEVSSMKPEEKRMLSHALLGQIRRLVEIFASLGITPGIPAFNSIITFLGGTDKNLVKTAQADMKTLGLAPTEVTQRSVLSAAGWLGDDAMIKEAWHQLVEFRSGSMKIEDLHLLITCVSTHSMLDWARQQCEEHIQKFSDQERASVFEHIDHSVTEAEKTVDNATAASDADVVHGAVERIAADITILGNQRARGLQPSDWCNTQLPVELLPTTDALTAPEVQREVYDEVTCEIAAGDASDGMHDLATNGSIGDRSTTADVSPQENESSFSALRTSPTNIPVEALRFENWRSINDLLSWAMQHDQAHHRDVLRAIDDGEAPRMMSKGLAFSLKNGIVRGELDWGRHVGLSEPRVENGQHEQGEEDGQNWRRRVLELRGYDVEN